MLSSYSSASPTTILIINAVGQDRLGIVSDITGMVINAGGNVGESQAAKLGSHFSLMMLVEVPADQMPNLQAQLAAMSDMNAAVFESTADSATTKLTPQIACKCSVHGQCRKVYIGGSVVLVCLAPSLG